MDIAAYVKYINQIIILCPERAITVYIHKSVLISLTILIAAATLSSVAVVAILYVHEATAKECNSNDDHNKENNDDSKTCANGQGSKNHYVTTT
jgi:hypothetical protein